MRPMSSATSRIPEAEHIEQFWVGTGAQAADPLDLWDHYGPVLHPRREVVEPYPVLATPDFDGVGDVVDGLPQRIVDGDRSGVGVGMVGFVGDVEVGQDAAALL